MLAERGHVLAAVARRVPDLLAKRTRLGADEDEFLLGLRHVPSLHHTWRDMEAIVARRIRRAVARRALGTRHPVSRRPAQNVHRMHPPLISLQRRVACGMAVLAARVLEDRAHGLEEGEALGLRRHPRLRRLRRRLHVFTTARGHEERECEQALHDAAPSLNGSERRRCPVAAKIAFPTAGATTAVAGSPTPPILALLF